MCLCVQISATYLCDLWFVSSEMIHLSSLFIRPNPEQSNCVFATNDKSCFLKICLELHFDTHWQAFLAEDVRWPLESKALIQKIELSLIIQISVNHSLKVNQSSSYSETARTVLITVYSTLPHYRTAKEDTDQFGALAIALKLRLTLGECILSKCSDAEDTHGQMAATYEKSALVINYMTFLVVSGRDGEWCMAAMHHERCTVSDAL